MIRIEIDDRAVLNALAKLQAAGADLKPAFADIGEYLTQSTKHRFGVGLAPDGTSWAPNRPATLARKRDTRPLIGESKRLSSEFSYRAGTVSLEFGSSLEYAATHQFGRDNIPARPFLGLSEGDRKDILSIVVEHLRRTLPA